MKTQYSEVLAITAKPVRANNFFFLSFVEPHILAIVDGAAMANNTVTFYSEDDTDLVNPLIVTCHGGCLGYSLNWSKQHNGKLLEQGEPSKMIPAADAFIIIAEIANDAFRIID